MKVNKVVSIEIASQVFWIDERAYEHLQAYLQKIQQQLSGNKYASEIFKDIELRIAELLYNFSSDKAKAITPIQLNQVIEQIGFLDSEDSEATFPKESYRDSRNKILGGVCGSLAIRLGVPSFIIRVIFIALTLLFGLGIALYLIFWISLDNKSNRNTALAAEEQARTTKKIATFDTPLKSALAQLQRIIFLPVSIIGALVAVIGIHFRKRRNAYFFILKTLFSIAILFCIVLFGIFLYEFSQSQLFPWPISWLLCAAMMYLAALLLAIYIREYYLSKPYMKIKKSLKVGALIPAAMVMLAIVHLTTTQLSHEQELVEKSFPFNEKQLNLIFNDEVPLDKYVDSVRYQIRANIQDNQQLKLYISYSSNGSDEKKAIDGIHAINYFFTLDKNTLELDRYWTLEKDKYNRGQRVDVIVEIPQNVIVNSTRLLEVNNDEQRYQYNASAHQTKDSTYITRGQYLHEYNENFEGKLSINEIDVLEDKFCAEFFISETWHCSYNINTPIISNGRFDLAFQQDIEKIEQLRKYLLPNRSIFASNLVEMSGLVLELNNTYPVLHKLNQYIEHLLTIKSALSVPIRSSPN